MKTRKPVSIALILLLLAAVAPTAAARIHESPLLPCGAALVVVGAGECSRTGCRAAVVIVVGSDNCQGGTDASGNGTAGCTGEVVISAGSGNCHGGDGADAAPHRAAGDGGAGCDASVAVNVVGGGNCQGGNGGDG